MAESASILDTPAQINFLRLCSLRGMLSLELKGMSRSYPPSAYMIIKREFGFRGNREWVYTQFCEYIEKQREFL
jgi:hypothetical protein